MLMSRPMKVRVLGEIFDSARPLTIFCSSQPLPFPNALVQVMVRFDSVSAGKRTVARASRVAFRHRRPHYRWRCHLAAAWARVKR